MLEAITLNAIMNYALTMIVANVCEREREGEREGGHLNVGQWCFTLAYGKHCNTDMYT